MAIPYATDQSGSVRGGVGSLAKAYHGTPYQKPTLPNDGWRRPPQLIDFPASLAFDGALRVSLRVSRGASTAPEAPRLVLHFDPAAAADCVEAVESSRAHFLLLRATSHSQRERIRASVATLAVQHSPWPICATSGVRAHGPIRAATQLTMPPAKPQFNPAPNTMSGSVHVATRH